MFKKIVFIGAVVLGFSTLALANGGFIEPAMPAAPEFVPNVYLELQGGYGMTHWGDIEGWKVIPAPHSLHVSKENGGALAGILGYEFHNNFGVEVGYTYFTSKTEVKLSLPLPPPPELANSAHEFTISEIKTQAMHAAVKLKVPFDNLVPYAKLGVSYLNSKGFDKVGHLAPPSPGKGGHDNNILTDSNSFNHVGPYYAFGVTYNVTPNFFVDASWSHFGGNHALSNNFVGKDTCNPHFELTKYQPDFNFLALGIGGRVNLQ
jgi:opacity protein-like surface antigen